MNPKISIITSCYNSEKHIEQCIQSVLGQNYKNLEYIIIDGGSTDKTLSIIDKYRDKIDYFVSEPDKGISDAFNKGIKVATGELIGIINSDDFMMPGALNEIAAEYDPSVDVYRGYELLYYPKREITKAEYPNNKFGILPIGNCICHEASFITKRTYEKIGLYKIDFKYMMDLDLFMRMYRANVKQRFLNVCVLTFRVGGASSSMNKDYIIERKQLILENGGTKLDAFIYVVYHQLKQWLKQIIFKVYPK